MDSLQLSGSFVSCTVVNCYKNRHCLSTSNLLWTYLCLPQTTALILVVCFLALARKTFKEMSCTLALKDSCYVFKPNVEFNRMENVCYPGSLKNCNSVLINSHMMLQTSDHLCSVLLNDFSLMDKVYADISWLDCFPADDVWWRQWYGGGAPSEFLGCDFPAFLSSFYTTFLKYCGWCLGLKTDTCLIAVVGGKQGHAPCIKKIS